MTSRETARAVAFLTAVLASNPLQAQARPADEAAARSFVAAFQTAWNARDGRGLASMYRTDADHILRWFPAARGRAEIERQWSALLTSMPAGLTIRIDVESIRPVTPDVMVVNVTGNFSGGSGADGSPLPRSSDRATYVLARDGDKWALASFRVLEAGLTPDVASGVRAARDRFVDAWRKNDAAGAAAVFTADAVNMVPGAPDNRGRQEIERAFADFLGDVTMEHTEFTLQEVDVRTYEAHERGTFVQRYKPRNADAVTQRGRYMAVWRREPGGDWQYHRFLFNWLPTQK